MAGSNQKDLLTRLADAGEEALHKVAEMPGATRLMEVTNTLRARTDEIQKRLRGLEALEARVVKLEQRIAALEGPKKAPAKKAAAAKKPAARKPAAKKSA